MLLAIALILSPAAIFLVAVFFVHRGRRIFAAVVVEQERREQAHHLDYRPDQRLRACQQRLSRLIGRRAFGRAWTKRLKDYLEANP